jgi:hypothetical protein
MNQARLRFPGGLLALSFLLCGVALPRAQNLFDGAAAAPRAGAMDSLGALTGGIPEEDVKVDVEILALMGDADVAKHIAKMETLHHGRLDRITVFRRSPHRLLYRLYFGDQTAAGRAVGYFEVFVIPGDRGERPRVGQAGDPVITP